MQEPDRPTLLTLRMSAAEVRVVKAAARARGMTMSAWIRRLLVGQLVDLER